MLRLFFVIEKNIFACDATQAELKEDGQTEEETLRFEVHKFTCIST